MEQKNYRFNANSNSEGLSACSGLQILCIGPSWAQPRLPGPPHTQSLCASVCVRRRFLGLSFQKFNFPKQFYIITGVALFWEMRLCHSEHRACIPNLMAHCLRTVCLHQLLALLRTSGWSSWGGVGRSLELHGFCCPYQGGWDGQDMWYAWEIREMTVNSCCGWLSFGWFVFIHITTECPIVRLWCWNLKERDHLKDLGVDGRIR